jgi:hypothetical protein
LQHANGKKDIRAVIKEDLRNFFVTSGDNKALVVIKFMSGYGVREHIVFEDT